MLARIQDYLEAIYGVQFDERASEFVVPPELGRRLGATGRSNEELLLSEDGDDLGMALYFSPELFALIQGRPDESPEVLVDGFLSSFCSLIEGVSHFLYVVFAAGLGRRFSLLELEVQAEIDKFATLVLSRWSLGLDWARTVHAQLFDRVSYNPHLDPDERWRYVEANRLARGYCARLLRHVEAQRRDRFLSDLRYSYRLGAEAKIQHFAKAA